MPPLDGRPDAFGVLSSIIDAKEPSPPQLVTTVLIGSRCTPPRSTPPTPSELRREDCDVSRLRGSMAPSPLRATDPASTEQPGDEDDDVAEEGVVSTLL